MFTPLEVKVTAKTAQITVGILSESLQGKLQFGVTLLNKSGPILNPERIKNDIIEIGKVLGFANPEVAEFAKVLLTLSFNETMKIVEALIAQIESASKVEK